MAPHSSTLAWKIPWMEEPGRQQSMGSLRGRTRLSDFTLYWTVNKPALCPVGEEGNGNPLQYSCLENPVDRETWWAAVHKVSQSQTRLKRLSRHACIGESVYGVAQSGLLSMWSHRVRND